MYPAVLDCSRSHGPKKKNLSWNNAILSGLAPDFIVSEVVFQVDALKVVIEVNVLSDQFFDLRTSRIMSTKQTFGFERTKEIFHGCVIVRAARTGHGRLKVESGILCLGRNMHRKCIATPGHCGGQVHQ